MEEFENKETVQDVQAPKSTQLASESSSTEPPAPNLFKNIWEYLLKFIKAPIATIKNEELETTEAVILLGFLPIASFLSTWSLMRSLITSLFRAVSGFGFGFGGGPSLAEVRSEALAEINWGRVFFNGLLTHAIWFALIMFAPLMIARIFKNTQTVDMKKLFSQMAVITIPMILLYLLATILGFFGLWLWFVPIAVSFVLPLLLHFIVIRDTFNESPDKALYITFITQVIIVVVASLWINTQLAEAMGGLFW